MTTERLAQRAANLSASLPGAHFPAELEGGVISFDSGFAHPPLMPDMSEAAAAACTTHRSEALQYAGRPGLLALREVIAEQMRQDGIATDARGIMLVNGAKHGIDLVCRLLLNEGDAIVVTAPTYFTAIPIFRSFGVEFIEITQDREGLRVEELETVLRERRRSGKPMPKFIYDVPDFHNPSGITMSLARRRALLDLALSHDIFLVEDSPYRTVRFEGASIPSLRAMEADHVIYIGTFAKLIAPGLRVGWVNARTDLLARMMQLKSDGGSSAFMHRMVYEFCKSPAYAAHSDKIRATYREHRDRMLAALAREMPEVSTTRPEGGYYVWLTLPAHVTGDALAERAQRLGVHIIPASKFYATKRRDGQNHARLTYSFPGLEQIDEGIRRLAQALRTVTG